MSDKPVIGTSDFIYAFNFLQKLATPFDQMNAFKHGIIDKNGKILKKRSQLKTSAQKASWTYFDQICVNLKTLLAKQSPYSLRQITPNVTAAMRQLLKEQLKDPRWADAIIMEHVRRHHPKLATGPKTVPANPAKAKAAVAELLGEAPDVGSPVGGPSIFPGIGPGDGSQVALPVPPAVKFRMRKKPKIQAVLKKA